MRKSHGTTTISGKLVKKLGVVLAFSTIVLLVFVSTYTFISAGQKARSEARVIAESKARFVESELSRVMVEVASIAQGFASGKNEDQISWSYARRILENTLKANTASYSAYGYWTAGEFRSSLGEDSLLAMERMSPFLTEIWLKKDSTGSINLGDVEDLSSPDIYSGNAWWDIPVDSGVQALVDPYYDQYAKLLMISAVAPILKNQKSVGLVGLDVTIGQLQQMADSTKVFDDKGKLMILASDLSLCALSGGLEPIQTVEGSDTSYVMPKLTDLYPVDSSEIAEHLSQKKTVSEWWGNDLAVIVPVQVHGEDAVWASVVLVPGTTVFANAIVNTLLLIVVMIISGAITTLVVALTAKRITRPLVHVSAVCRKIATGDIETDLTDEELNRTDEIGDLARGFQQVIESWRSKIESAQAISQGNLQTTITLASDRDQLGLALQQMKHSLSELVQGIVESSHDVYAETASISALGATLTDEASRSAASVEEMSAALREIRSTMEDETKRIESMEIIANEASMQATNCRAEMANLSTAMTEVSHSSEQMAKIIKTIDSIAFQTKLLALNAAVEAARAGVHGKGFAVVADEVRTLASRSAKAAQETQELIERDRELVRQGYQLTEKVSSVLSTIVSQINRVDELVAGSVEDSKNQLISIDEITTGLVQIEQATTTTAMTADQTRESLNKLENESATLNEMVSHFSVEKHGDVVKLLN